MAEILFITHPEVVIDPDTPVPEWPLSDLGRRRMANLAEVLARQPIAAIWSSAERKARDGAEILAARFGVHAQVDIGLHENDRSATGYVAPPEFWEIVADFFAKPHESVRGWERAIDAQSRIVAAVTRVAEAPAGEGLIAIVSHGGVGRLLTAHLQGVEIGKEDRPGHPGGGCILTLDRATLSIVRGWRNIEDL
jgi:broad specificity phosphatase PhoE